MAKLGHDPGSRTLVVAKGRVIQFRRFPGPRATGQLALEALLAGDP